MPKTIENAPENALESSTPASVPADKGSEESTATADGIASDLVASMPAPQAHAIEQARQEMGEESPVDAFGHAFDKSVHAVNSDGTPKKTPTGRWAKIPKTARESTLRVPGAKSPSASATSAATPAPPSKEIMARATGKGAANLFLAGCLILGGEEWQPRADPKTGLDERAMLESVFGDYCVATGTTDLPPGWALAAGIFMYAGPRFAMPKTQTRISKVKSWIVAKYVNWRNRKQKGVRVKADTDGEE